MIRQGARGGPDQCPHAHPTRDGRRSVPDAGHRLLAIPRGKTRRPEDYSRRAPWLQADGVQLATAEQLYRSLPPRTRFESREAYIGYSVTRWIGRHVSHTHVKYTQSDSASPYRFNAHGQGIFHLNSTPVHSHRCTVYGYPAICIYRSIGDRRSDSGR